MQAKRLVGVGTASITMLFLIAFELLPSLPVQGTSTAAAERQGAGNLAKIKCVVVVMLENRSFDNMLGFLYAGANNKPSRNLPAQSTPTFDGLVAGKYWNPANKEFFTNGQPPVKVFASTPTTGPSAFTVPNPDPNEAYANFTFQIFGKTQPADQEPATMLGFYVDYLSVSGVTPDTAKHIMESYSPAQVPVLSALAKNYAVCDRWFAAAPAQTWPNRAFVHTGTSLGEVTNNNVLAYNTKTIYEVLQARGISWKVYNDSTLMSLTRIQYPRLLTQDESHFVGFDAFKMDAKTGKLPAYSFVEPSFVVDPNDQHPPHDVAAGEKFLLDVFTAVSTGPGWPQTLLIITYDEHGGCYDHVPPPWGAVSPDAQSNPGQQGCRFNRFGVRVPAVVVSPLIEPGTVFRSPTNRPYDHTSILATLRDWQAIPPATMLASKRIAAAPTLAQLLTRATPRTDKPVMTQLRKAPVKTLQNQRKEPLSDLQRSMLVAAETTRKQRTLTQAELRQLHQAVPTKGAMHDYLLKHGFKKKQK